MNDSLSIYFAGDLFNHKDLIGNLLLSSAIEKNSSGRFKCIVPQHLEQSTSRSVEIRNNDLLEVVKSDLILLNFDGTELDSGTVVEFLFAKALDIPAVILRTDFRSAGDQERGNPWNLMCSGYPRTRIITLNSMSWYQEEWRKGGEISKIIERFYKKLSIKINKEFELVLRDSPIYDNEKILSNVYDWAINFPGSGFKDLFKEEDLKNIIIKKQKKNLY